MNRYKRIIVVACLLVAFAASGAYAINDTNLVMHISGNQLERIVRESQENWNCLADGKGALTNGLTVIGNTTITGTLAATSVDAGSVTDITLSDGQVLDSADTTNVTLTGAERAASGFQLTAGGSTNVAGDDVFFDIKGRDLFGTSTVYFAVDVDMTDTAPGTQDGTVAMKIPVAGTETTRLTLNAAGGLLTEAWTVTTNSTCMGNWDVDVNLNVDGSAQIDGATVINGGLIANGGGITLSNATIKLGGLQQGTNGLQVGEIYYDSVNGTNAIMWFGP